MLQLYEETAIQDIADKIRQEMVIEDKMSVIEMPDFIEQLSTKFDVNVNIVPSHLDADGNWVRPEEYEDLSQLELDDNVEEAYLSLYNRNDGMWHLGLYATAAKGYKVELGHVNGNQFIASETYLKANNAYFEIMLPENEVTMVARITPQDVTSHITLFRFGRVAKATSGKVVDTPYYYQPVVERIGRLPYITSFGNSGTSYGYGACYLEHDAIKAGYKTIAAVSLNTAWQYCYNLQQLEVNDWNTTFWTTASLANTWQYCYSLKKLDLSNWDTTNWKVTNLSATFQNCLYLTEIKQNWNTTNWAVTTMANLFDKCYSIEIIDLSNWDTTNWTVTSFGGSTSTFSNCHSLKEIKQNWNTTNWKVASLQNLFANCFNLQSLDISNWNTTNWVVTNLSNMFSCCYILKEINLSSWDTTNWVVTNLGTMFNHCYQLKEIDLSSWDTSRWVVTSMNTMFTQCFNLKYINLNNWDTSNWALAASNSSNPFGSTCYSVQEIDMEGWDFSGCKNLTFMNGLFANLYNLKKVNLKNWKFGAVKFTSLTNMFNNCYSLKEIDLLTWDTSNFEITTLASMCGGCRSLKSFKQNWNTTNWKVTSTSTMFNECFNLEEINLSNWDISNWPLTTISNMFANCRSLKNVNLSNWKISKLNGTMESVFRYCYNLQSLNLSSWDTTGANITSMRNFVDDCFKLKYLNLSLINDTSTTYPLTFTNTMYALTEYYPPIKSNQVNFSLGTSNNLSHDSIMRVINGLPKITSAHTITLGLLRAKLTADEIAIATQKGWTVA